MPPRIDPRVDAYVEQAVEFARPILVELRARVHQYCPDVVETIKWRAPAFEHGGLLGGMVAFKSYCGFMWWQEKVLLEADPEVQAVVEATRRMTSVKDLPGKRMFQKALKAAMALNADGPKKRVPKKAPTTQDVPAAFAAALQRDKVAKRHFDGFAAGYRREYIEWIAEAKREATRERRIAQAIEWLREGKRRNWKYENY
ncbi:MAG: YdeI/OmpD-associated family protein [Planctomycetes bacterium]|nr:YdeI/OmpD-associated family protein [Planctomycetota bacterium]